MHNKKIGKNIPIQLIKKKNNNNYPFSLVYVNNSITNNINNFINKKKIIKSKNSRKANKNKILLYLF